MPEPLPGQPQRAVWVPAWLPLSPLPSSAAERVRIPHTPPFSPLAPSAWLLSATGGCPLRIPAAAALALPPACSRPPTSLAWEPARSAVPSRPRAPPPQPSPHRSPTAAAATARTPLVPALAAYPVWPAAPPWRRGRATDRAATARAPAHRTVPDPPAPPRRAPAALRR